MRITKEPEERRQEIFDAALKLFGEKGYEKTTITDIAKTIGVAQGLCYRYFPSKEALFDSAIEQYADELVSQFADLPENFDVPLREFIERIPAVVEDKESKYYAVFHGPHNKKFHHQLSLKMCEKWKSCWKRPGRREKFSWMICQQLPCFVSTGSLAYC